MSIETLEPPKADPITLDASVAASMGQGKTLQGGTMPIGFEASGPVVVQPGQSFDLKANDRQLSAAREAKASVELTNAAPGANKALTTQRTPVAPTARLGSKMGSGPAALAGLISKVPLSRGGRAATLRAMQNGPGMGGMNAGLQPAPSPEKPKADDKVGPQAVTLPQDGEVVRTARAQSPTGQRQYAALNQMRTLTADLAIDGLIHVAASATMGPVGAAAATLASAATLTPALTTDSSGPKPAAPTPEAQQLAMRARQLRNQRQYAFA